MIAAVALFCITIVACGQGVGDGYEFRDIVRLPCTSIKSQDNAGTCWSWSTYSFLESEMLRLGKPETDLSALFAVWYCYDEKAQLYVRRHGTCNFDAGGAFVDVLWTFQTYGAVPLSVYSGLNYGEDVHMHSELNDVLKAYVKAVVKNGNGRLSTAWRNGLDGILNAYLGEIPEKFTYKGVEYTPLSFAKDYCGLNMDDYVSITSFTHHPFYTTFAIEVEDNWLGEVSYNIPLDELMDLCDKAIDNGFTFAWGTDCSEDGFTRSGLAVAPDIEAELLNGNEALKWVQGSSRALSQRIERGPLTEKKITQELRQAEFDNYLTTDDHGMHVIGKAEDKNGTKYFIVKNSWGEDYGFDGYWYASYPFFAYKTLNIIIHKDAIPAALKNKLGIK